MADAELAVALAREQAALVELREATTDKENAPK